MLANCIAVFKLLWYGFSAIFSAMICIAIFSAIRCASGEVAQEQRAGAQLDALCSESPGTNTAWDGRTRRVLSGRLQELDELLLILQDVFGRA